MVWNRRARKGGNNRINPKATANERSRRHGGDAEAGTDEPAELRPHTVHLYRGMVKCGLCGQRLNGNKYPSGRRYYVCYPRKGRSRYGAEGHPESLYLPEQALHATVIDYLATAIFGPGCATRATTRPPRTPTRSPPTWPGYRT